MANREKKVSISKRQSPASPVPPAEAAGSPPTEDACNKSTIKSASAIAKKLSKTAAKRAIKKNLTIQLKAKTKQQKSKINSKLTKNLLDGKKSGLLKNGLVKVKQIKNKPKTSPTTTTTTTTTSQQPQQEGDDKPPVLEPIFPVEDNVDKKPQPKKRANKKPASGEDQKKIKIEEELSNASDDSKQNITIKKVRTAKKSKPDSLDESLEEVMKDLSCLITNSTPKEEIEDIATSPPPPPADVVQKPKKYSKKQLDALKRKLLKKENLENTLKKMEFGTSNVIDMLDLNVRKLVSKPVKKRRHSIEKYPLGDFSTPAIAQLSLFNNVPRSISPRTKRSSKIRQSIDNLSRRSSPYTTRSDSPARILRNGKLRKLKDLNLLEGLDVQYKRRRRLCSDFSGSELSVSKVSGYDSDSSFSDMSSLHGTESSDVKDTEVKKEEVDGDIVKNINDNTFQVVIKANISNDTEENMDSNSNLYNDVKPPSQKEPQNDNQFKEATKIKTDSVFENLAVSPSLKVPDKSIILNIMKQTFNFDTTTNSNSEETTSEKEKRTTRASTRKSGKIEEKISMTITKFYGNSEATSEIIRLKEGATSNPEEVKEEVTVGMETEAYEAENAETMETEQIPVIENIEMKQETSKTEDTEEKEVANEEERVSEINDVSMEMTEPPVQLDKAEIKETPENLAIKENILQALGLQSLKAAEEAKMKGKERWTRTDGSYTGTLKTVIKINRCEKKKGKNSLKMTLQKNKPKNSDTDLTKSENESGYKIMKEGSSSTTWKNHSNQSSDTAGGHRKSHYSNRSNMDGSSEHTSDGDTPDGQTEGIAKTLVIPEKASSFSIHPERLCKDECSYCFGKFGLFDTPCHIAQMKSVERQNKILAAEKHLTRDSCLCDACYRHVDRKANTPSYSNKSSCKRGNLVAPGPRQNHCHVLGCNRVSSNILRRKWIIKMRKSVCKVINIDLDNPGLHSIPICDEHYAALEHLMVCAMCKRRLARNHIQYLGPECSELNVALNAEGIPVKLTDKPVVCKLCRYFATLILRHPSERPENTNHFYKEYRKRLLHFHDVEVMDKAAAEEPIPVPTKENKMDKEHVVKKKKKTKSQSDSEPPVLEPQVEVEKSLMDQSRVPSDSNSKSRSESPSDYMIDYKNLIPSIALECGSDLDTSNKKETKKPVVLRRVSKPDTVKEAVEISKNMKLKNKNSGGNDAAVQRLGSNPSISVRQLFPGEEELPLQGHIDFGNVKERTPEGWEKCTATIQYDLETKNLWQELQKPYGNQSSFLRHLILLEKYFRNGDLVLNPNATHYSVNYSESVQNRLRAYDNIPSTIKPQKSSSGIVTSKEVAPSFTIVNAANIPKNTPITISQISNLNKQRAISMPPGLISLQQNRTPVVAPPLIKVQQSQKIKFPITKNWRPNLIPIDPNKKIEKKAGLVQVISGGKPYHITIEDYKKMCAIKKSFEMKAKRLQDAQKTGMSVLRNIAPKKNLVITKTSTNGSGAEETGGSILEKLDRVVEKLDSADNHSMILPKIPKSLTVIPQTVARKPSRPASPVLMITTKPKATVKS